MTLASSIIDWPAVGRLFLNPRLDLLLLLLLIIAPIAIGDRIRRMRAQAQVRARAGGVPMPREVWWAEVPFEDVPGAKDRPCLVVKVKGRSAVVAKITSKHHDRPGVIPLPRGMVRDQEGRQSWLETDELREVPFRDFRRRVGPVDERTWALARRAVD